MSQELLRMAVHWLICIVTQRNVMPQPTDHASVSALSSQKPVTTETYVETDGVSIKNLLDYDN